MTEILTTLHPENDEETNLYPNVKKENIPNKAINFNKLDDDVKSLLNSINELKPSGTDTSTHILAFTENKGIYVATDNGHWYYWNGTQYLDGGVYQAIALNDNSVNFSKLSNDLQKQLLANYILLTNLNLGGYLDMSDYDNAYHSETNKRVWCDITNIDIEHIYLETYGDIEFQYAIFNSNNICILSKTSGWINKIDVDLASNAVLIRLVFRHSDESNFDSVTYPNELLGKVNIYKYDNNKSNSFESLSDTIKKQLSTSFDISFNQGGYLDIQDYAGATKNTSTIRTNCDILHINTKSVYIECKTGYQFICAIFDANNNLLYSKTSYNNNTVDLHLDVKATYIRLGMKKADNTAITPANSNENIVCWASNAPKTFDEIPAYIYDKLNVDNVIKIKVGTYNVGHFNYGLNPSGYDGNDLETKINNFKSILLDLNADILGIEENSLYFDRAQNVNSKTTLFDPLYKYNNAVYDTGLNTSLFSKYEIKTTNIGYLSGGNRQYVYAQILVENKILNIFVVHLALDSTDRLSDINQLLSLISNMNNVIILGDFNIENTNELEPFITSGLKIVNGGYLPFISTYYTGNKPIDNIITSNNINICNIDVKDVYDESVSDHLPLVSELIIY